MCRSMVDIHSATAEIRRGKKKERRRKKKKPHDENIMFASATQVSHNKVSSQKQKAYKRRFWELYVLKRSECKHYRGFDKSEAWTQPRACHACSFSSTFLINRTSAWIRIEFHIEFPLTSDVRRDCFTS